MRNSVSRYGIFLSLLLFSFSNSFVSIGRDSIMKDYSRVLLQGWRKIEIVDKISLTENFGLDAIR